MSFRKDGKASLAWRRWKTNHQDALLRCGLPDFLLKTQGHWIRFLQEGGYDAVTGWKVSMLSKEQQQALYALIQKEYGKFTHRCVLHDLETLLGIAPPPMSDSP